MSRPAPKIQLSYTAATEERILKALDEKPPSGYSRWNGRLMAEHLGNVSKDQVWRVMRKHHLHLDRRQSWCVSTDPEFSRKAADVVGLYLHPPESLKPVIEPAAPVLPGGLGISDPPGAW